MTVETGDVITGLELGVAAALVAWVGPTDLRGRRGVGTCLEGMLVGAGVRAGALCVIVAGGEQGGGGAAVIAAAVVAGTATVGAGAGATAEPEVEVGVEAKAGG